MRNFVFTLSLLFLFLLSSIVSAQAWPEWGPFVSRTNAPFKVHQLRLNPSRIDVLPEDTSEITLFGSYGNMWLLSKESFMDYEFARYSAGVCLGVGSNAEVGFDAGGYSRYGGFLDAPIEAFHSWLGLENADRELYPQNKSIASTSEYYLIGPSWDVQDISLYVKYQALSLENRGAISIGAGINLPFSPLPSFDLKPSFGLWAGGRFSLFDNFQVYSSFAVIFLNGDIFLDLILNYYHWSAFAGLEWRPVSGLSFFSQLLATSPAADIASKLAENAYEFTNGFRVSFSQDANPGYLEIGVVEDIVIFGNVPDITFTANLVFRYE